MLWLELLRIIIEWLCLLLKDLRCEVCGETKVERKFHDVWEYEAE